jgi:hypothetical protein
MVMLGKRSLGRWSTWLSVALVCVGWLGARGVHADAPVGRFTVNGDGTVRDNMTQLVWQQAASASAYTWVDAQSYCVAPWRLPTIRELLSIVDFRQTAPAIDRTAFPNTPAQSGFWSSSPYADGSSPAWGVSFSHGISFPARVDGGYSVRCVR